jgi:DNA excision repair protein ERCC-2
MPHQHVVPHEGTVGLAVSDLPREVQPYFPYSSVRPYQNQFITAVYNALEEKRSVLIEGSNGLGKTISALSACLPVAVEKDLKILYVARTHRQHDRVIEELKEISKKQPISGVSLRGRNEMCLNSAQFGHGVDAKSLMDICEMLKAKDKCPFYSRMEERSADFIRLKEEIISCPHKASEIQQLCRHRHICPYELIKAALPEMSVIALSYLYVFDPVIRQSFMKHMDTYFQKVILVVDEAHNLPDTAIDIASSNLSLFVLKQAEAEANKYEHKDIAAFANLMREEVEKLTVNILREAVIAPETLMEIVKRQGSISNPRDFFEHAHEVGSLIRRSLLAEGKNPRSYIHGMSEFLLRWLETLSNESYINVASKYVTRENVTTAKLEIVALDPSQITVPVFSTAYASVLMSGTLQPLEAFARITRLPETTVQLVLPCPFPKEHVLSVVCCGVTTAMEKRIPEMYQKIIERINEVVENTPANTGVFVASFDVLNALMYQGIDRALKKPLFRERRGMTSRANEQLVREFKASCHKDGAVFMGVLGGRTSEGVDFPGNQMNSVIVVGVPYAEPTPRVKAQIDYYEKRFPNQGREYGYVLPAMKKASQAAGRPIRTLEDKGAIVLLDYRYAAPFCRGFLPSWVTSDMKTIHDEDGDLAREISCFFKP